MYLRIKWYFRYLYHVSGYSPCWSSRSRRTSGPRGWRTWPPRWSGPFMWWGPSLSTFTTVSISVPVTLVAIPLVVRWLVTTAAGLLTISSATYIFMQTLFFLIWASCWNFSFVFLCQIALQTSPVWAVTCELKIVKKSKSLSILPCCCCCWGGGCGCCPISGGGGCGKGAGAMFVIMGGGLSNPCPGLGWGRGWIEGGGCVGCNVIN